MKKFGLRVFSHRLLSFLLVLYYFTRFNPNIIQYSREKREKRRFRKNSLVRWAAGEEKRRLILFLPSPIISSIMEPKMDSLVLSTPSEDFDPQSSISYQDESSLATAKALHASKAFGFPFTPYSIQVDLMKAVFRCIEDGKVGIFESPTGTVSLNNLYFN